MLQAIAVPLDGSALARRALPYAVHLCRRANARLVLVRAVGSPGAGLVTNASAARVAAARQAMELQAAESEMAATADELRAEGLTVEVHVQMRGAVDLILDVAQLDGVDLVAMSTHGRTGIGRFLYGSVADEVLRRAEVPVLLVPPGCERPWPSDRRLRVLVPLDGSALAEDALGPARALAEVLGADLVLVQVVRPADVSTPLTVRSDAEATEEEAKAYLDAVAASLRAPSFAVATRASAREVGQPASALARMAREEQADLIVMATHGRGGLARLVLGSVATDLLPRADVPIAFVRPAALRRVPVALEAKGAAGPPEQRPPAFISPTVLVRDIMSQPAVVVPEDATLFEVAQLMLERRIGCVPVVDRDGRLQGIVTESDFTGKERPVPFSVMREPQVFGEFITAEGIEAIHARARTMKVWEIMSRPVETARETEPVTAVVTRMIERGLRRLPVVRDGVPVGMVTRHDVLRLMARG